MQVYRLKSTLPQEICLFSWARLIEAELASPAHDDKGTLGRRGSTVAQAESKHQAIMETPNTRQKNAVLKLSLCKRCLIFDPG